MPVGVPQPHSTRFCSPLVLNRVHLTRGLKRVSTEMNLRVLPYNLNRMISILGVRPLLEVIWA